MSKESPWRAFSLQRKSLGVMALALRSVAEYEGEFVADASDGGFLKGTQWLVWKFESDATLADACQVSMRKLVCCSSDTLKYLKLPAVCSCVQSVLIHTC